MPSEVVHIGRSCALLRDGRLACFEAELTNATEGKVLGTLPKAIAVASDDGLGGCAVREDGKVSCLGELGAFYGSNGLGPFERPQEIEGLKDVDQFDMLAGRACARTKSGRLVCVGCFDQPHDFGPKGKGE